jgi:hypothetical protein
MAFLDNSGDIILDAVLTDTGRYRLAKADGSFRIAKFALGDDEIDYSLYNSSDTRGSAYFDEQILNTPIFEAFTDNYSGLKSKLLSIPRNDLLFLPVIKLNQLNPDREDTDLGVFCVAADEDTEDLLDTPTKKKGFFGSANPGDFSTKITIDQGLDTAQIAPTNTIDSDLKETQYIIEMDSRLGTLQTIGTGNAVKQDLQVSYIDDDQIASYYLTLSDNNNLVADIVGDAAGSSTIAGPRGTRLQFALRANLELQYSTFLFEQIGFEKSLNVNSIGSQNYYIIDTNIRVTGATTGYKMDIPVRFLKKKN